MPTDFFKFSLEFLQMYNKTENSNNFNVLSEIGRLTHSNLFLLNEVCFEKLILLLLLTIGLELRIFHCKNACS